MNPELLLRVKELFNNLNWSINDAVFERFCDVITVLGGDEQDLLIELTERYLRFEGAQYFSGIPKALSTIKYEDYENIDEFFILPLLPKDDFGNGQKSAYFVSYIYKAPPIKDHEFFNGRPVHVIDAPTNLPKNIGDKRALLILVDDFIGSGETAERAIKHLLKEVGIPLEKILVVVIVAQQQGMSRINELGVSSVQHILRTRGISDNYHPPDQERLLEIIDDLEDHLGVFPNFRRGYNQSEALVTMNRTPNNTFPVYWLRKRLNDGTTFIAPFPRD